MTTEMDGVQSLATLAAPERNAWFYGKLLDDAHLRMEQRYFNRKRWLLNRLAVGTGVLCGLTVRVSEGVLVVSPGVALDAYGREVIVPRDALVDPWIGFDAAGTRTELRRDVAHTVWLCLAYQECEDELVPVLVTDCDSAGGARASTIVEQYSITVRTDAVPALPARPAAALCAALHAGESPADRVRGLASATMAGGCAPVGGACIPLARVTLTATGTIGAVDACTDRPVAYGNDELFDMILCLAARVEECCGDTPTPTPAPVLSLAYVSGDNQSATVGTAIAQPLVVEVRRDGAPRPGEVVTFAVQSGGGAVRAAAPLGSTTVTSDASGLASLPLWKLGAAAGPNTVRASIAAGTPSDFLFHATATVPVPVRSEVLTIAYVAGDNQSADIDQFVAVPPEVIVLADGAPAGNRRVTFAVVGGGGHVAATVGGTLLSQVDIMTGANGHAVLPAWKLGSTQVSGGNKLTASIIAGLPGPVPFSATGVKARTLAISLVSGDGQGASGGARVPQALVVDVMNGNTGVPNEPVTFAVKHGGGSVSDTATGQLRPHVIVPTDAAGRASLPVWRLGNVVDNVVDASIVNGNPDTVHFKATAKPSDAPPLKVVRVELLDPANRVVGRLSDESVDVGAKAGDRPMRVRFTFNAEPDPASLIAFDGTPASRRPFTVVIVKGTGANAAPLPGSITVDPAHPKVATWSPADSKTRFAAGAYTGMLKSDAGRPPVTGLDGRPLDGEPTQLPSGNGTPGGTFTFHFSVA